MINRKIFYDEVRIAPFGGVLTQRNIDGVEPLLNYWEKHKKSEPLEYLAYILAGVFRETGGRMVPVREGFAESDKEAQRRVEEYCRKHGKKNYAEPSHGFSWFGRGRIQNTHYANYVKIRDRYGIDVVSNPSLLLESEPDAKVTIEGHFDGIWTGRKLENFWTTDEKGHKVFDAKNARKIVNGLDHASEISQTYKLFLKALKKAEAAGLIETTSASPAEMISEAKTPPPADGTPAVKSKINISAIGMWLSANLAVILSFFQSADWKVVAILSGLSFVLLVLVIVFRKQISYRFGA